MKEKLLALLNKLGLADKAKNQQLTEKDWESIAAAFKKEHGVDLEQAIEDSKKATTLAEEHQNAVLELLKGEEEEAGKGGEHEDGGEDVKGSGESANEKPKNTASQKEEKKTAGNVDVVKEIKGMKSTIKTQQETINKLSQNAEQYDPEKIKPNAKSINPKLKLIGSAHTESHVFGLESDHFKRDNWWNELTATQKPSERRTSNEVAAFKKAFGEFGESLSERVRHLHQMGNYPTMEEIMAGTIDYSDFDGTGWGDEYVVRRQDALIAYLRTLPSVSGIFPIQYGVQNKQVMTNSFFDEFSQAWQEGRTFKGGYKLQPMEAQVDDVQFKHLFSNLKDLEKEYIGYYNREGSDPMKWTFLEWIMARTLEVLMNEKNRRRIRGVRVEPQETWAGKGNPALFGANGVLYTLFRKYVDEFRLLPFDDLNLYTSSTILAYVESFVAKINNLLDVDMSDLRLYMNQKHIPWYMQAYREKYGEKLDFEGVNGLRVKDYSIGGITPIPNMKTTDCRMFITMPGNVELYEDERGEMERVYFERELESLIAASWWKEGAGAYLVGRKYTSKALLQAAGRGDQFIFINDPFVQLDPDATTVNGALGEVFKTDENTGATAITTINNVERGVVYRIECGSTTDATTIAKSGDFSEIESAWNPTAVGDFIEVYWKDDTSKFHEVRRQVTA